MFRFRYLKVWTICMLLMPMMAEAQEINREFGQPDPLEPALPKVLDLETAQRIASADNPSLAAALDRVRQARARVMQARSAYWPSVDADASGARVWTPENQLQFRDIPEFGDLEQDDTVSIYRASLSATWLLFDGFARKFRTAASRFAEQGTLAARADARRLILSAVADSYYNAQLARENMAIAAANEAFNKRQAEDARARREVGTGSLSDVLNFEVQVNSARTELLQARESYRIALYGLAALMGIPEAEFPADLALAELDDEQPAELTLPEPEPLILYAYQNRPDLLGDKFERLRAESNIGVAKSRFLPSIALTGSVDGERADDLGYEGDDFGGSIALTFSYNLFEGGNNLARLREARAALAEAENLLQDTRISVASDVREALASLQSAQEQVTLQRENAKLVRQNRDLVEKEYNAGQASLVRLNEAQRNLIRARSRLAQALVSLRQAWQNLAAATGEILEPFADESYM
ncbi:MAG: TolC family protein [Desulfococcaceae bacterium]